MPTPPRPTTDREQLILDAAAHVFVVNPDAPIADVADRAGVGMSAIYRRFGSKEDLIATLCLRGQERYLAEVDAAVSGHDDPVAAFRELVARLVDAGVHALSNRLAGRFAPTPEHIANGILIRERSEAAFTAARSAGAIRPDVTLLDVGYLLEVLALVNVADDARNAEMRARLARILVDGLDPNEPRPLPQAPPTWAEQELRWIPADHRGG